MMSYASMAKPSVWCTKDGSGSIRPKTQEEIKNSIALKKQTQENATKNSKLQDFSDGDPSREFKNRHGIIKFKK